MPVFRLPSRRPQPTPQRLIRRWRLQLLRLWRQDGSHGHRARGLAAGIFTGCYPFFGLQIVLGVGLAALLRGSPILAAAGTWISNPVTSLPLYWFNYQVGCLLLGAGPAFPSLQQVQEGALWDLGLAFSTRLMLGSTVVGLVSALALGGGFWWWAHRQPSRSERDPGRSRSTQRSL